MDENSTIIPMTVGNINFNNNNDNVDWREKYDWSVKIDKAQPNAFTNEFNVNNTMKKHSHYYKDVSHLNEIDVYRVIELFGVVDPCLQHSVKKLLVTGGRDGNKSKEQDVKDVIASCNRWLEMQAENKK